MALMSNATPKAVSSIIEFAGPRELHGEAAVFIRPIGEIEAQYYKTRFNKLAEISLIGYSKADTLTIIRPHHKELPELLIANTGAVEGFESGLSYRGMMHRREHMRRLLTCRPELSTMPLLPWCFGLANVYDAFANVGLYGDTGFQILDRSQEGLSIRADWSGAFLNVAQPIADGFASIPIPFPRLKA